MRLLLLDFDKRLVAALVRTLQHEGVAVVAVENVEQAKERVASQHFDVAVLDCDLIDAAELAAFAELPVILTTSFLEPEGHHRFFRQARLLRKPFTNAQLSAALRATCGAPNGEPDSLVDVLRHAHSNRQSLALGVGQARLYLEDGELVHAELDGESGERALVEVLARDPEPVLVTHSRAPLRSIHRPFQVLMLDLLHRIDEREQRESERARSGDSAISLRKGRLP